MCLQAMYNIPTTPAQASNNTLYVTGLGGDVANLNDLQVLYLLLTLL